MIRSLILFLVLSFSSPLWSQNGPDPLSVEEKIQMEYQKRIRKTHINGYYIPKDLEDAMQILDGIVEEEGKIKFAREEEDFAVRNVFFSFGRWMNVNWGLEQGSRLTVALNQLGVSYPDDMVYLLMYSYYRHLNHKNLDLDHLILKIRNDRIAKQKLAREEAGLKNP